MPRVPHRFRRGRRQAPELADLDRVELMSAADILASPFVRPLSADEALEAWAAWVAE